MTNQHAQLMQLLKVLENPYLSPIDLHLGRMERLMQALGNPQSKLPPVVHVAGTNGKGSVIAYLRALLEASGKTVHIYTSPHLIRFNERIVLAGEEVGDAPLIKTLQRIYRMREQFPGTLFELVTAAAFCLFAEHKADMLLLEVGLGGRLDATNLVAKPAACVIMPISLDHTEYLGSSLAAIAAEKAGILKKGVPCVVGAQEMEALRVIESRAAIVGAPLYRYGKEWTLENHVYKSTMMMQELPQPALLGAHQWLNAATAVAVADLLHQQEVVEISQNALCCGITDAKWRARLQPMTEGVLLNHLPEGSHVWLDGGHNPGAGRVIAEWLRLKFGNKPSIHLVCGMMQSKDAGNFFAPLAPFVKQCVTVPILNEPKAFAADALAQIARYQGMEAFAAQDTIAALQHICRQAQEQPLNVLITGSLYLAGMVLASVQQERL